MCLLHSVIVVLVRLHHFPFFGYLALEFRVYLHQHFRILKRNQRLMTPSPLYVPRLQGGETWPEAILLTKAVWKQNNSATPFLIRRHLKGLRATARPGRPEGSSIAQDLLTKELNEGRPVRAGLHLALVIYKALLTCMWPDLLYCSWNCTLSV